MINPINLTKPRSIPPVLVRRHPVKWEEGDPSDPYLRWLADMTFRAIQALGLSIREGCHFITPAVTVSCREPTAAFFREALDRRGSWLRELRRTMGNNDPRQVAKLLGTSDRQVTLSGVMFIDGSPVPPANWNEMADGLLPDKPTPRIKVTRRPVDLSFLKAAGDTESLKEVALDELGALLAANPDAALYVTPGVTVAAPTSSQPFLAEARKRADEWHGKLYRTLGGDKKPLLRAADLPTLMLAYCGTLVIGGQCYIPGCWPNENATKARLKRTPFQAPTVPPSYLGLDLSLQAAKDHQHEDVGADCLDTSPTDPGDLNELFARLFTTGRPWLS